MGSEAKWLWQGSDQDGVECRISHEQWERHVAKRREIEHALLLTVRAMVTPETVDTDRQRPDEPQRRFRLLTVSADELRPGYCLRVSVKYVRQGSGDWTKFFQSAWLERKR